MLQDKLKDAEKNNGKNMMNCGAASISIWRELSVRVTLDEEGTRIAEKINLFKKENLTAGSRRESHF